MTERQRNVQLKIIRAVLELLQIKNIEQMTSDEICQKADVSKRTLYKYFESKSAMYLGVVEYCFGELNFTMQAVYDDLEVGRIAEIIKPIGRVYFDHLLKYPDQAKIIVFYDESQYRNEYPDIVGRITKIANVFEGVTGGLGELLNREMSCEGEKISIMTQANLLGLATLLQTKKAWLESGYNKTTDQIVEDNLEMLAEVWRNWENA